MNDLRKKRHIINDYKKKVQLLLPQAMEAIQEADEDKAKTYLERVTVLQKPILNILTEDICEAINPVGEDTAPIIIATLDNISEVLRKLYPKSGMVADTMRQIHRPRTSVLSFKTAENN